MITEPVSDTFSVYVIVIVGLVKATRVFILKKNNAKRSLM